MNKRILSVCFVLLMLAAACFAAPSSKAKIFGAVESKTPFSGDRLFAVLDSVGGSGTWMEWDVNGVKDPSIMEILGPALASSNKPEMVWVISERTKPLLATLLQKAGGEVVVFYELKDLDGKPEPLKMNPVLTPDVVFRDYRQVSATEFIHLDKPNLKVTVSDKKIRFTYTKTDENSLNFDPDFSKKNQIEKKNEVRIYWDFLMYEYSLMLRAFIQSTRGMFNWQPWHWYMKAWNGKYLISEKEVEAILMSGHGPEYFTIFKTKTAGGETVEFCANGNGFFEMTISTP